MELEIIKDRSQKNETDQTVNFFQDIKFLVQSVYCNQIKMI